MRDLAGDEFALTQEFIAEMLGVQRPTVSVTASKLRKAGLISYSRGCIRIADPDRLRDAACECYNNIRRYEEDGLDLRRDRRHNGIGFSSRRESADQLD